MSTLLVVEDEYRLRKLVARTLEGQGHTVIEASNGVDAIALAGTFKNTIDMVITDIIMPMMRGPDMVQALRRQRPDLKVIYMSGTSHKDIAGEAARDAQYLDKPCSLQVLTKTVGDMLSAAQG